MRSLTLAAVRIVWALGFAGAILGCGEPEAPGPEIPIGLVQNSGYLKGQTLAARSGTSAGNAAIYHGKAYFPYIRTDSRIGIVVESDLTNGGGQSATAYGLTDLSNYGATLFSFDGFLDLFYVGQNGNLYMRRSGDGLNWAGPWALDTEGFWRYVPAPVALDNTHLSLFTVANLISGNTILEVDVNNTTVTNIFFTGTGSGATNRAPAATIWNGQVFLSWAGSDSGNTINIRHTSSLGGSGTWSPTTTLSIGGIPSLIPLTSQSMELVFRGNDSHIYRTYTSNGVSFDPVTQDPASTTNEKLSAFMPQGTSDAWVYYIGQNNGLYTALE